VEKIGQALETAAAHMEQNSCSREDLVRDNQDEWYGQDCKQAKQTLNKRLHRFRRSQSENDWRNFIQARMEYKAIVRATHILQVAFRAAVFLGGAQILCFST